MMDLKKKKLMKNNKLFRSYDCDNIKIPKI
jgi:hypothetical protein